MTKKHMKDAQYNLSIEKCNQNHSEKLLPAH